MHKSNPINKSSRSFGKIYRQKRIKNEVERCKDLEQRDNYRRLIEIYGHKTLAETAPAPSASNKSGITQGIRSNNSLISSFQSNLLKVGIIYLLRQ